MEKKTEYRRTPDGTAEKRETIGTTPEDGAVPECEIRPGVISTDLRGKYHKGYSTTKTYQTNNPKVTRLVLNAFCGMFLLIGIITLAAGLWFFSIVFIGIALFGFVRENRRISAIAGETNQTESPESRKEATAQIAREFQEDFKQSARETFTEDRIHRFTKLALPVYAVLVLAASGVLAYFVSKILAAFVFLMLTAGGALYFFILKLIGKACQKKD